MRNLSSNWRHFDFWLLGAVAVLTIFGITMIRSTIAGNIEVASNAQRQLIFALLGSVVLLVVTAVDYHLWASLDRIIYVIAVIVLMVLNVVGNAVFGSSRWFRSALIYIQPSEVAKIVIILTLAAFFARNRERIQNIPWVLRSFVMTSGIAIWVILQPNLSTTIVIFVIWAALLFAAGFPVKYIAAMAVVGGLVLGVSVVALVRFSQEQAAVAARAEALGLTVAEEQAKEGGISLIQDYQLKRILNFVSPDPEARQGDAYNLDQAVISIGSGGLTGQGYNHGSQVQLRFLKVRWSDFIFSAAAQEFGFVGIIIVFILEIFVVFRCLRAARIARDTLGALICYGVATLIAFQGMVNVGVNLRLIPATGLPLPFISYGGSALLSLLIGIGLVESVVLRHKTLEF